MRHAYHFPKSAPKHWEKTDIVNNGFQVNQKTLDM